MAQNQAFDLHDLYQRLALEMRATWRYRWQALIAAWCVAIIGALLVFSMPNQYEASAQVYADTQALQNPLLHGVAVQPDVRARLQVITQTMVSRPNLEAVADQTGLSLRATSPADKDALLLKLGSAVKVSDAGPKNLYDITYSDRDPQMAQKVVQAFLQILMNDTLGANSASMQTARAFLKQQVGDYNNRLDAAETKIAEFKKANAAYLPTGPNANNDYATRLQAAQANLQALQERSAHPGAVAAVAAAQDPRLQQVDKQIAALQQNLDNLLLKYTDAYPDVQSTRRMLGQLKARRSSLLAGGGSGSASHASQAGGRGALTAQIAAAKQAVANLEQGRDKATDVQTTLQQLTRDYEITRKQYDELVARLNTAQLSEDATQSGNNLKFRVISPPIVPLLPESPSRGVLLWVVFAVALLIGAAFAFFLHRIRPVFVSLKSLREGNDFPVLGSFGLIVSSGLRRRRQREVIGFCAGVGLLALVVVVGFAFNEHAARLVQHVIVVGAL